MYTNGSEIFNRLGSEKKQFILTQIVKEFGEAGYDSVSMRKIAQNTQVSIGSLYQYFGDKEGTLKISIEYVFVILSSYIEEIKKAPLELEIRLEKMFDSICRVEEKYPEIIKFYNKIPSDKRMIKEWVNQFYKNKSFFTIFWQTIYELQQERKINDKLDPVTYTFIIDTLMLSGEVFHDIQYQKIKTKVFLDDLTQSNLLLKENIIDSLIELVRGG
ncbi:TetR/AcrR family transcriptional regulator [Enterococcus cecorum]|uniref:TetR/AcrR family transcriptional regulator n=1 Tax=Enterococcus cecorum TaxID=44008 RepID=UPI000643B412|nr:TetR/AcrR family transcriptional regulator [Enterococcus cecorum]KLO72702.1 TetR family transcriptional regulator [Enterococcus cecorum]